jgi:hypothetical protein
LIQFARWIVRNVEQSDWFGERANLREQKGRGENESEQSHGKEKL